MTISRKIVEQLVEGPLTLDEARLLTVELDALADLSDLLQKAATVGHLVDGEDVHL